MNINGTEQEMVKWLDSYGRCQAGGVEPRERFLKIMKEHQRIYIQYTMKGIECNIDEMYHLLAELPNTNSLFIRIFKTYLNNQITYKSSLIQKLINFSKLYK